MKRFTAIAAAALGALALAAASALAAAGGSPASGWHIGYYTPSAHGALSNAQAPSVQGGIASLGFTNQANTALLTTDQKAKYGSLVGDLRGKTITATFTISGASTFVYYGEPSCGNTNSTARLYFDTSNAGGFDETHYWWSNPASAILANGTFTVTATVTGSSWSDFYGHYGNDPSYAAGFDAAAANVTDIGLSFGGGCFFENGVGTADGSGTLVLTSFTAS